ncbi:MAG TPA: hypothetical protein VFW87_26465 [Pirellulales bacterium]|nr:hypothetical protein [Pirellulales bacterium]
MITLPPEGCWPTERTAEGAGGCCGPLAGEGFVLEAGFRGGASFWPLLTERGLR